MFLENRIVNQEEMLERAEQAQTNKSNFETTGGPSDNDKRRADKRSARDDSRESSGTKVNERTEMFIRILTQEFDPGSGRTLAACLIHASRTELRVSAFNLVANG